ncbi:MAG: sensor histidine kinase [Clostridiales bacterium]|nr:sensor histidine kinase [Clostridiales bacterium]
MTSLEFYKYFFVVALLAAEALFVARMERRRFFPLRLAAALVVCVGAAAVYPVKSWSYTGWHVALMSVVLFSVTLCGIMFVFRISFKNAVFCASAAYTAQHLSYEIYKAVLMPFDIFVAGDMYGNEIFDISSFNGLSLIRILVCLNIYAGVYIAIYFILGKRIGANHELKIKSTLMLVLSVVILLVDVVLNAVTLYIGDGYNSVYDTVTVLYNCLCCLLVWYIQYSIINVKAVKDELETVSYLLRQSQAQYELKKEQIDLINIKCHDMKHRLAGIKTVGDLSDIEDIISVYDATVKTGNDVLDTILTEKSLVCRSKDIKLMCMADGSGLAFMNNADQYAMFGNIIDNAVEAVVRLEDKNKRYIDLNIRSVGVFVSIMAENYYEGELSFSPDGFPVTLKADKNSHGFGLKSVKYIAEKYGGNLSVKTSDGIFSVAILIPVKATEQ